jgi:hypothetical protein
VDDARPADDADDPEEGPPDAAPDPWFPVTRWLGMAAVLATTVWFSANHLPRNAGYPIQQPARFLGDFLLEGWMRWDGGWYVTIAAGGYSYEPDRMSSVAFFPAYPMALRLLQHLVRDPAFVLPGIVLSLACGLGGVVLLHRWCRVVLARRGAGRPERTARTTVLVVLVYPYAWYLYGAVYADALFLLCAVGAFVLVERDRPVLAGIVAAVATAARPVGVGLAIGLAAVLLERREVIRLHFAEQAASTGWRQAWRTARAAPGSTLRRVLAVRVQLRRLRPADAGVLTAIGGLVAWMAYLQVAFGDRLLFAKTQSAPGWDQGQGPRTWLKIPWLGLARRLPMFVADPHLHWDRLIYTLGITFQALLVVGALCLLPAVVRRVGWGYALYVVGVVAVPILGSKDWQGTGRYLLAAFPVLLVVGGRLAGWAPSRRRSLLGVSAALLVFLTSAFARGFYLA